MTARRCAPPTASPLDHALEQARHVRPDHRRPARRDARRSMTGASSCCDLTKPFSLLPTAIANNNCFIMPERVAKTDPFKQIDEIIGSGPYRFVRDEWVAGSRAVYAKFAGYNPRAEAPSFTAGGKVVHFDRVEWQVMPDPPPRPPPCRPTRSTGSSNR